MSIDEDSFDELDLQWPWPRALHGRFLNIVSRGMPLAIGLDLVFPEPSSHGPADDRALAESIARAGNVVLGAALTEVRTPFYIKEDLNPPLDIFRERAAAFGFVNFIPDEDAFVRRASLTRPFQGGVLFGFDHHLYRLGVKGGIAAASSPPPQAFFINYRGGRGTFPTVPFYRVLNGEVGPENFRGKIILVGATSPVLHDVYPTPFATHGEMPGVEIHANVLETLFQGDALKRAPLWVSLTLTFVAGLLGVWVTDRLSLFFALGAVLIVVGGYAVAAFIAFVWGHLWLDIVPVPAALLLGYGTTVVEHYIQEQREKRRLSRFFSPAVVAEIIRQKDDVRLGSTRRRMTVLFSDIRGFTAMSEKLSPEEVVAFLREYLTIMTEAVFQHGGTVDKYIGDAVMALYNVPLDQPEHAQQAVRTALDFQERLRPLAARFREQYGVELSCGVGIHTGEAIVGTIGSEQRLEYTAIGDTINLGSRLEHATKDFNVPIVISEDTYQEVRGQFLMRHLGDVLVKGKGRPIKIYAVAEANLRKEVRVAVQGAVTITDDKGTLLASVTNLSSNGLSASDLPKEFAVGQVVQLRLELSPVSPPIDLHAKVAWSLRDKAGFAFLDPKLEHRATIEKFVARTKPS